jgi:NodT family efflux transporter outer membrane factor (OMF) lipoprotein
MMREIFYGRLVPRLSLLLAGLLMLLAAGCVSVGPDYKTPELTVPVVWQEGEDPALVPAEDGVICWWTLFDDPLLEQLIEMGRQSNLDLRIAVARVREAWARLGVAAGQNWPAVDAAGSVMRQRSSENSLSAGSGTNSVYNVGLDASWELDLFGRISRSVEAARADYQASEEDRVDVLISLYAEIARTYFNVRTSQARLAAAVGNLSSQRQVLDLTRSRFRNGLATGLDVAQAERVLATSEAVVPPLRIELTRALNSIAVLLGQPPGALFTELSEPAPIPVPPARVAVGVPADLLRQRPDIRRAERQLAAQTARIGIATADLYPRLSLSGFFAFEALEGGDLLKSGSRAFSFGPTVRWLLFDGKRVRSQIQVEDARTEQALYQYEQTMLNALNEAENAMTQYLQQQDTLAALERSQLAGRRSVKLATGLYKDGLSDFQNVLDSQRALFEIENQLAAARGDTVINLVQLYKAIGGGWNPAGPQDISKEKP